MTVDEVRQIVAWLEAAGLTGFELTTPQGRLRLQLASPGHLVPQSSWAEPAPATPAIAARGTGVFLDAHPWSDTPLVRPGQRVQAGETAALLRTGALIQPVTAAEAGVVGDRLVTPGTLVGFGTPLFAFTPEDPPARSTP